MFIHLSYVSASWIHSQSLGFMSFTLLHYALFLERLDSFLAIKMTLNHKYLQLFF